MRVGHIQSLIPPQTAENKYISQQKDVKFSDFLTDAIEETQNSIATQDFNKGMVLSGDVNNLHEIPIATTQAELSLNFAIQIRNKVLDAYNEVMRMQV